MSRVSWALRFCFHSGMAAMVCMLCRRSASLMSRTRGSLAMATSILRMVAACWACLESKRTRSSLVTPSTMAATSGPNSRLDLGEAEAGVLDRVVEQGGGDGHVVEAEAGQDGRHRQRVGDVGLARVAQLALRGPGRPPRRPGRSWPVSSRGWRARKALSSGGRASAVCTWRRQGSTRSTVATARVRLGSRSLAVHHAHWLYS